MVDFWRGFSVNSSWHQVMSNSAAAARGEIINSPTTSQFNIDPSHGWVSSEGEFRIGMGNRSSSVATPRTHGCDPIRRVRYLTVYSIFYNNQKNAARESGKYNVHFLVFEWKWHIQKWQTSNSTRPSQVKVSERTKRELEYPVAGELTRSHWPS